MQELINAIKAWPVIIQGTLGSALFWLVLVIGQKIADKAASHLSTRNKKRRLTQIFNHLLRLRALRAGPDPTKIQTTYYIVAHLYRLTRPLIFASILITLGLAFDSISGIFSIIGYVGGLYYLFNALAVIRHIPRPMDLDAEIKILETEFNKLEDENKT